MKGRREANLFQLVAGRPPENHGASECPHAGHAGRGPSRRVPEGGREPQELQDSRQSPVIFIDALFWDFYVNTRW